MEAAGGDWGKERTLQCDMGNSVLHPGSFSKMLDLAHGLGFDACCSGLMSLEPFIHWPSSLAMLLLFYLVHTPGSSSNHQ